MNINALEKLLPPTTPKVTCYTTTQWRCPSCSTEYRLYDRVPGLYACYRCPQASVLVRVQ